LKAAWELMEIFYADKLSQSWLPERLVDWLAVMIFLLFSLFVSEIHFVIFSLVVIVCDSVILMVVSFGRIMIASSPLHRQQSIQNLWIFRKSLLLYRFDTILFFPSFFILFIFYYMRLHYGS
jgi:hypothetical protein